MNSYDSGSGGSHSHYSPSELRHALDDCKILVSKIQTGHPNDPEEQLAWANEGRRRRVNLKVVQDEIDYRFDKEEAKRLKRERREEERWRKQDESEKEAAGRRIGRDGQIQNPRGKALTAYFERTGVSGSPRITKTEVRFVWRVGGQDFYGIYTNDTKTLKVFIRVDGAPNGSKMFRGHRYLPATTSDEIAAAAPFAAQVGES